MQLFDFGKIANTRLFTPVHRIQVRRSGQVVLSKGITDALTKHIPVKDSNYLCWAGVEGSKVTLFIVPNKGAGQYPVQYKGQTVSLDSKFSTSVGMMKSQNLSIHKLKAVLVEGGYTTFDKARGCAAKHQMVEGQQMTVEFDIADLMEEAESKIEEAGADAEMTEEELEAATKP